MNVCQRPHGTGDDDRQVVVSENFKQILADMTVACMTDEHPRQVYDQRGRPEMLDHSMQLLNLDVARECN